MKKIATFMICISLFAGCVKKDRQGIGVVPLEGAKVTGKVVDSTDSGVLLKTSGGRTALLPDSWRYASGDKSVDYGKLAPGQTITAYAPDTTGRLVAAPGKNLVLADDDDTFVLPLEAFPTSVREVPVRVQTYGGQTSVVPLQRAIYSSDYTVLSHPYYSDYEFPQANPYSVARAYPVGTYDQNPLALVPGASGLQLMSLPTNYYPVQNLQTNQPVRFTYYDNNVSVSSWDSLQDGQISLSKLLLAGTLLKILPGQALIQVGAQPVMVPRSYIYQNGYPVAWNTIQTGAPVNVQYYPGVYNVVDYSNDLFTFNYNNSMVQLPVRYLPDNFYHQPVSVCYQDGARRRLPYGQAKKLIYANSVRMMAYNRPPAEWTQRYNYRPAHTSYVTYADQRHYLKPGKGKHNQWPVYGAVAPAVKYAKHQRQKFQADYKSHGKYKGRGKPVGHALPAPRRNHAQPVYHRTTKAHYAPAQVHHAAKAQGRAARVQRSHKQARQQSYRPAQRQTHRAAYAAPHHAPRQSPHAATQRAQRRVQVQAAPQRASHQRAPRGGGGHASQGGGGKHGGNKGHGHR